MSTISLLVFPFNARAADAPMALIQTTTQKTLAVLQNPAHQGDPHRGERLAQVAATILPHFDTEGPSRSALGPYWRQLTANQQQEFV
jgi:ABC-type transporter MlaC component